MKLRGKGSGGNNPVGRSQKVFGGRSICTCLSPVKEIDGTRIRELTGDSTIPDVSQVTLIAYRAVIGERTFHVGFCLGNETGFSAIGIAVIERLMIEAPGAPLHVVQVAQSRHCVGYRTAASV